MNKNIFYALLLTFSFNGLSSFAQNDHIGEWKLVSQKVIMADGRIFMGDSTNILQRKILTSDNQVVVIGERIKDGYRLASSVHGGYYTLKGKEYTEKLNYSVHKNFDKMKCNFEMTLEGDKMRQVGILEGADGVKTTYDEVYVRVKHPADAED